MMGFLFPGVEMARREAIAYIDAMRKQMDDAFLAEQPIRDLIADVLPLLEAAERSGERPTLAEVPWARRMVVTKARVESDIIACRPILPMSDEPERIFGLKVVDGPVLRVR